MDDYSSRAYMAGGIVIIDASLTISVNCRYSVMFLLNSDWVYMLYKKNVLWHSNTKFI